MILLHVTPHVYATVAAAEAVAASNNAGDEDGWTYVVRTDPLGTGKAHVIVIDDEGIELGPL